MPDTPDIAPALLEAIRRDFLKLLGGAEPADDTYPAAEDYAGTVGAALAEAFRRNLSSDALPDGRMYWNIADRVLRPLLEEDHRLVSIAAARVQQALNEAAGLGLKAQTAPLDADRVDGILNKVAAAEHYDDVAWVLDEPVKTFSRAVVDETLRRNVEFQGKAGLRPRVVRRAESRCCEWCAGLEGSYNYPDVPRDVYRRHERCRCVVEYDPGEGRRQNVWSKSWTTPEERATLETRKAIQPDRTAHIIQTRINQGKYNLQQKHQQYLKHVDGTPQYQQYMENRKAKWNAPQGRLSIDEQEAQRLIYQYAGKGKPRITKGGSVADVEYVTTDRVVGQYYDSKRGWVDTRRIEIHYGKKGCHIVPVEEKKND